MTAPLKPGVRFSPVPELDPEIARAVGPFWWPLAQLAEGVEALSRASGLSRQASLDPLTAPASFAGGRMDDVEQWLDWAAQRLGVEAEAIDAAIPEVGELLRDAGPAIIFHSEERGQGFLLLLRSSFGAVKLLASDLSTGTCAIEPLRTALCWRSEAPLEPETLRLLEAARVAPHRRAAVKSAMLRERLASERIGGVWMLRTPASTDLWRQLARAGVPGKIAAVMAVFALIYSLEIVGWSLIGGAALNGRLDFGWLAAWLLLVLTMVPWRLVGGWLEARFALDAGRILKSRLLAGALRMDLEAVTRQGVGHLLGRVMEAQALESLALSGGMTVLVSVLELAFAGWILSHGAAPFPHLALLTLWLALTAWMAWRFHRRLAAWSAQRLDLTNDLIEGMVGHRTRLAQERPGRRDAAEDKGLETYLHASRAMDQSSVFVLAGLPSGWVLLGLIGLIPAFMSGTGPSPVAMGISLAGVLVAQRAMAGVAGGLSGLSRATISWRQVTHLFEGSADEAPRPFLTLRQMQGAGSRLIDAQGLTFDYEAGGPRIIDAVDLTIARDDRILLEGASGGGKSTLAALLSGLRTPRSGLLLLNGLDRHTLGDDWRRLVAAAPQFQQNHVLSGTLAFNLLMGRSWPASEDDLREAEALCEELGLGELLRRMPAGIHQRVGETGWQLSHGERSRIFLARALLQGAPLTIMDESFGALDPETLDRCLETTLRRAKALVVIAHP
jgi:ATP-binding cassette subfamily B protein